MNIELPHVRASVASEPVERTVAVLGATGSIGASTIDLLKRNPERFRVEALCANRNVESLARSARELRARFAAVADVDAYRELKAALSGSGIEVGAGEEAIIEAAARPADLVVAAISGAAGLRSAMAAIDRGATIALANKECLVCAGDVFMQRAAAKSAAILPVDSEHNALFQAMSGGRREDVRRVILTASGGPFRTWSAEEIRKVTPEQAQKHPNWSMGAKITVDSATMMNKGLEVIEAHHLFNLPSEQIDVLVHPQSIVHGLVEFRDGSLLAQLGSPDMRIPIAHCLAWPDRIDGPAARLDLAQAAKLEFEEPDLDRFPALALARQAMEAGLASTTVLNAANEIAVAEFLAGRISFTGIPALVALTLEAAERRGVRRPLVTLEDALEIDQVSRAIARDLVPEIAAKVS